MNRIRPLTSGGTQLVLHAGKPVEVSGVLIDRRPATYRRDGERLLITTAPIKKERTTEVEVRFSSKKGKGGFHWIESRTGQPERAGFWTQGETELNRDWAPTWDYPNDFTTSETITTVPADWSVVGNGKLISNRVAGGRRTFTWRMDQPHATYLLSLVGGPLEIRQDTWQGVELLYTVPKGKAHLIEDSFGDTKDMLSYFSGILGVKYPWSKYAQNAMYDFGGGMENISSTTLGQDALTERREGFRAMAGLNAHELAHQWFGDLVTCANWGELWLNEGFATFFGALYSGHSRGRHAYDQEIEGHMQGYFQESRRYKRPLSTNFFSDPEAMFDAHSYPKGSAVLHTLRRYMGDRAFLKGLNHYLRTYRHKSVTSLQLAQSISAATGIDVKPFFDQWVFKPGHPVIAHSWTWEERTKRAYVSIEQKQNTADGTPIYDLHVEIGLISEGKLTRKKLRSHLAGLLYPISLTSKPDAIIFDPDHDFLREIPSLNWSTWELAPILEFAPCGLDRTEAMRRLLANNPTAESITLAQRMVRADNGMFPSITTIEPLGNLAKPELRGLFLDFLRHKSFSRRAEAVSALSKLPEDGATTARLRALINATDPVDVVVASIKALDKLNPKANEAVIRRALSIPSLRGEIKAAATEALK